MNLVNMLINQLSNNNANVSSKTKDDSKSFGNILSNVQKDTNNKPAIKNKELHKKSTRNNDNEKSKITKKDDRKDDKKLDKDEKIDKKEDTQDDEIKEKEINEKEINEKDIKEKDIKETNELDEKILTSLEQVLQIPKEKITEIMNNLSINLSDLNKPQNLLEFVKEVFEVENEVVLLSKENIKDIILDLNEITKNMDSLEKLENIELKSTTNDIQKLLEKLDGKVEEVSTNNKEAKVTTQTQTTILPQNAGNNSSTEEETTQSNNKEQNNENQDNSFNISSTKNVVLEQLKNNNVNDNTLQEDNIIKGFDALGTTKTANITLPKTQVLRNINMTDTIAQIMDKIKSTIKPNVLEVRIVLNPENLGEVSLKIATRNGIITAEFIAESQRVKEVIESNFNKLKDTLQEQGIDVGALEVNVSSDGNNSNENFTSDKRKKSNNYTQNDINEEILNEQNEEIIDVNSSVSYTV